MLGVTLQLGTLQAQLALYQGRESEASAENERLLKTLDESRQQKAAALSEISLKNAALLGEKAAINSELEEVCLMMNY